MALTHGSEKVRIEKSEGSLEGLWLPAGSSVLDRVVLLCHPHPLHGGTMETKLVARVARRLSEVGYQTLRFNFRGVGRSEGTWSGGSGERADARAALAFAVGRLPRARFATFGFSFGAVVALEVGAHDPRVSVMVGVAPPVRLFLSDSVEDSAKPKLIVAAGRDQIVDTDELVAWTQGLSEPIELLFIDEADHLFTLRTDTVAAGVVDFLGRTFV